MNSIAQQNHTYDNAEYDDSVIVTSNCCQSTVLKGTAPQNTVQIKSFKKLKPASKDKQIKLTHHKSITVISKKHKRPSITLKKDTSLQHSTKLSLKIQRLPCQKEENLAISSEKKGCMTLKCLNFKNKIVHEHEKQWVPPYETVLLTPKNSKSNTNCDRHTMANSEALNETNHYSQQPSNESQRIFETPKSKPEDNERQHKNIYLSVNKDKSQKTLEKLYENQSGKRIQTLISEMSHVSEIDQQSVAEVFDWREHL